MTETVAMIIGTVCAGFGFYLGYEMGMEEEKVNEENRRQEDEQNKNVV